MPYAFTQEGVAMLSGLLRSPTAVQININIMRAFIYMRQHILQSTSSTQIEELKNRIIILEERSEENLEAINDLSEDSQKSLDEIYLAFSELAAKQIVNNGQSIHSRKPIGFRLLEK